MAKKTGGAQRVTARIDVQMTSISPLIHGAGTSGNTTLLRTQEIIDPDSAVVRRVPFIAGNAFKGQLRRAAAHHALQALGVEEASLKKAVVDLLFTGGGLSKKSGGAVDLGAARELARLFPMLSLLGYAAGNSTQRSRVSVSELHLVCQENTRRLPGAWREHPMAAVPAARLRGEDFGTRHEATSDPEVMRMLASEDVEAREQELLAKRASETATEAAASSQQMIYNYQCVIPGARWYGDLFLRQVTMMEVAALQGGLTYMCSGRTGTGGYEIALGAKSSVGLGRMDMHLSGEIRHLPTPPTSEAPADLVAPLVKVGSDGAPEPEAPTDHMDAYVAHLQSERAEILTLLEKVA